MVNLFNIFGPPALAGRVLWNRVCPSFRPSIRPSVCPGVFLELYHFFFWIFAWCQNPIWTCSWGQKWAWSFDSLDPEICWISLKIELIFCMMIVIRYFFIRPTSHFLFLTFKCKSTAVVLVSPLAVAWRILWNRVCPSFPPDICLSVFLEFDH